MVPAGLFEEWCGQTGLSSLPATINTIGLYMTELATGGAKVATISRKLAAISTGTRKANCRPPAQ